MPCGRSPPAPLTANCWCVVKRSKKKSASQLFISTAWQHARHRGGCPGVRACVGHAVTRRGGAAALVSSHKRRMAGGACWDTLISRAILALGRLSLHGITDPSPPRPPCSITCIARTPLLRHRTASAPSLISRAISRALSWSGFTDNNFLLSEKNSRSNQHRSSQPQCEPAAARLGSAVRTAEHRGCAPLGVP